MINAKDKNRVLHANRKPRSVDRLHMHFHPAEPPSGENRISAILDESTDIVNFEEVG